MPLSATPLSAMPLSATVRSSDSVIGSLCREVDATRRRCHQVEASMHRCQDRGLLLRLGRERDQLQARRRELLATARAWRRRDVADPLALDVLIELSRRPVAC